MLTTPTPAGPPPALLPGEDALAQLTKREWDVFALICEGHQTREIAARLFISQATVRNHVQRVLAKLGVKSRVHAVLWAARRGLIRRD